MIKQATLIEMIDRMKEVDPMLASRASQELAASERQERATVAAYDSVVEWKVETKVDEYYDVDYCGTFTDRPKYRGHVIERKNPGRNEYKYYEADETWNEVHEMMRRRFGRAEARARTEKYFEDQMERLEDMGERWWPMVVAVTGYNVLGGVAFKEVCGGYESDYLEQEYNKRYWQQEFPYGGKYAAMKALKGFNRGLAVVINELAGLSRPQASKLAAGGSLEMWQDMADIVLDDGRRVERRVAGSLVELTCGDITVQCHEQDVEYHLQQF